MLLSRFCLVAFIYLQCIQFEIDEASANAGVAPNSRGRLAVRPRTRNLERSRLGNVLEKNVRCPGNQKICRLTPNLKLQRSRQNKKRNQKCCKRKDKMCQRRMRRKCKNTKCLIKQSRKCQKQLSRCKKRKSYNRRPSNCDGGSKRPSRPSVTRPKVTTTAQPVTKKAEKEECTATEECQQGLCCARHNHRRICKRYLQEGQICPREYRKRSPEMFEQCPCADGMTCAASEARHHTCQVVT